MSVSIEFCLEEFPAISVVLATEIGTVMLWRARAVCVFVVALEVLPILEILKIPLTVRFVALVSMVFLFVVHSIL